MARIQKEQRPATDLSKAFGDAVFTYLISNNLTEKKMLGGKWSDALSNAYTPNQVGMFFRSIKKKGHSLIEAHSVYGDHKRYWTAVVKISEESDNVTSRTS